MINAPWALRQVVPRRPVIMGKKVELSYHESADHLEVDVDVGSSTVCNRIYRSFKGLSKHSVEELTFLIEAQAEDELPEMLLGAGAHSGSLRSST